MPSLTEQRDLASLPADLHWFCPRDATSAENATFFDEDVADILLTEPAEAKREREERVQQARMRKSQVLRACQILAFDGEPAQALLQKFKEGLEKQLVRCTICVREFHRGRHDLKHGLEEQHDSQIVADFMRRFDDMNIQRIVAGLDQATHTLTHCSEGERSITILDPQGMYALFESMHCTALLGNDTLLKEHFDIPFQLVQTRKKITLPEYTPALTAFLFSDNTERSTWALRGWKRFKRPITAAEFEWTVRDNLMAAIAQIKTHGANIKSVAMFWRGLNVIVGKLPKEIITHHLRAMEADVYMLALDHLQLDFEGYPDLVGTLHTLLQTSPTDFWDALGAIPPQTVAEQFFQSPVLEQKMMQVHQENLQELDDLLQWTDTFVRSIKATNLAPACRAIVNQLMTRAAKDRYTRCARSLCWKKGLKVMTDTLQIMNQTSAGSAVVADLQEVVRLYIHQVLDDIAAHKGIPEYAEERALGLDLVRSALALDCHSFASIREDVLRGISLGHDLNISSLGIWKAATRSVRSGDIALASAVLLGVQQILIFEPITAKQSTSSPKQAEAWNDAFGRASAYVRDFLEDLQDLDSSELLGLIRNRDSAQAFFAAVFSGHAEIQQTATTIVKVIGSAETRRDGIRNLLEQSFTTCLSAIAHNFKVISRARLFAPCRTLLKIGNDMLDCLCSPQDGLLRSRKLSSEDIQATEVAWQSLWLSMGVIFKYTEHWSLSGQDKNMMMEFCRDAMDFADQSFDQYSVITGALHEANAQEKPSQDIERRLLQMPREASGLATKWLRLRDEYLVSKAVSLTCRIMGRLHDVDLQLPEDATFFIDDIVSGTTRNKLTIQQKAELRRALELHLGLEPEASEASEQEQLKPQKQGSLSAWIGSGSPGGSSVTVKSEKTRTGIDMDSWRTAAQARRDDKGGSEALRKVIAGSSPTLDKLKSKGILPATRKTTQPPPVSANDFRRKRQEEQEAKKKRDQAALVAAKRAQAGLGQAGSGLAGIGVEGKDHSSKGQGVMVSSDESSDDDDDLDAELFGISKSSKRTDTVKRDAAGAIGLKREQRQPVKLQRQIRSAKDMRARLAPDLAPLHKIILGWDFFHDGEYPPNSDDWQFDKVANSFRHVLDYQNTFRSLLTLEAWQGFVKSREENTNKPYGIKIVSRSSVDAFIEVGSSLSHAENREVQLNESDVILLSRAENPTASADEPHCLARVYRIRRQKQHLEIIYRVMPGTGLISSLTPGNLLHGIKVQSITPLEREYGALLGLQYYDLCDEIIKARPSPLLNYTDKQLQPIIDNYKVNKAQAKAVKSAVDNDAFTLIQGPPGSGKTKTIVAIVGALLTDSLAAKQGATKIELPRLAAANHNMAVTSKKLLVCAPSNAAVDELVMRFKDGVKTIRGVHKKVNVVRLGRSEAINSNVIDVTMDELVRKKLGQVNGDKDARDKTQQIMREHQAISEQLRNARTKQDSGAVKGKEASQLQDEIDALKRRKFQLGTQIDTAKDAETQAGRTAELERKRVQQAILDEADVICATLSGSGHEMFQSLNIEFETVVVDEAAQCVEMSALIPLKYGCAKCILVGDPRQLPPTVFSKAASANKYEQSLFVRMQNNFPDAVHLLDTQYRMHPDISSFPSATFYDGKLLDGDNMAELRQQPWHSSGILSPYRFFDVQGQHQAAPKGHSLINLAEIEIALSLFQRLTTDYSGIDLKSKIGIITPYKSQLRELKQRFSDRYGASILEAIDFNTTDAFQGRESDIIIFSCVRASPAGNVGFLSDIRRMNVGITRAKSSLWILGNSQSLMRGEYWKKLIVDAQDRGCYTTGDLPAMFMKHSSSFPAKAHPKSKNLVPQNAAKVNPISTSDTSRNETSKDISKDLPSRSLSAKANAQHGQGLSDGDAMEGVKTKLEDKISSMRQKVASEASEEDNDMPDADQSSRGGTMTPRAAGTPGFGGDKRLEPGPSNPAARPPIMAGRAAPPIIRKRKPADPFMPARKQQKRS